MPVNGIIEKIRVTVRGTEYWVYPEGDVPRAEVGDSLTLGYGIRNVGDEYGLVMVESRLDDKWLKKSGRGLRPGSAFESSARASMSEPTHQVRIIVSHEEVITDSREYTIQPPLPEGYTLTITATPGGITEPTPGTYTYLVGARVDVRATPDADHRFIHWFLDGADIGRENPIVVLMDRDHKLEAVFEVKIPTKLHILVHETLSKGPNFTNSVGALVRADTGEGIEGKYVYARGSARIHYPSGTDERTRTIENGCIYLGAFDLQVHPPGPHNYYFEFLGDEEYAPCVSEEIWLTIDPNLIQIYSVEEATPMEGIAPLTVHISGYIQGTRIDPIGLPIHLVIGYDSVMPPCYQIVDTTTIRQGTARGLYDFTYTFTRPGRFIVHTIFRGNEQFTDYRGAVPRTITVTGEAPPPVKGTLTVTTNIAPLGPIFVNESKKGEGSWTGTLPIGSVTVAFGDVSGYSTPPAQIITVVEGVNPPVTGVYEALPPATGMLNVTAVDPDGVMVPATITVNSESGVGTFQGTYDEGVVRTVIFNPLPGAVAPPPETVTIIAGETISLVGVYVPTPPPDLRPLLLVGGAFVVALGLGYVYITRSR